MCRDGSGGVAGDGVRVSSDGALRTAHLGQCPARLPLWHARKGQLISAAPKTIGPHVLPPYKPAPSSGPQKTMMLQPSEGVVSVARTGQAVQPVGTTGGMMQQGASTAFWIVSLIIGIAVGALAYVVVLQL